jgi:hypothetical protein
VCEVLFGANACGLIALCVLEKPASFELVFEVAVLVKVVIFFPY